jgi:hypothetical protein
MHWVKAVVGVAFGALTLLLTTTAVGPVARAQATPGGPALTVTAAAVTATGMSPGGAVVWLGMARKVEAYEPIYVRRHGTVQADAKGQAELPVTEAVPRHSIWLAVDLKTGAYATASPAGFVPLAFTLSPEALEVRGAALADRLIDTADYGELLLVRPGKGAWGKAVGRGGADDESATGEAVVKLSFDKLLPVPGTVEPAPAKLSAKDLVVVLHPRAMAIAALTFEAKP